MEKIVKMFEGKLPYLHRQDSQKEFNLKSIPYYEKTNSDKIPYLRRQGGLKSEVFLNATISKT